MVLSFHSSILLRQFSLTAAVEGERLESVGSVDALRFIAGVGRGGITSRMSWDCERPFGTLWYQVRRAVGDAGLSSAAPVNLRPGSPRFGDEKENGYWFWFWFIVVGESSSWMYGIGSIRLLATAWLTTCSVWLLRVDCRRDRLDAGVSDGVRGTEGVGGAKGAGGAWEAWGAVGAELIYWGD